MRPFKFFFVAVIGLMIVFTLAKFVLFAAIIAAFLSIPFFILRKVRNAFLYSRYRQEGYDYDYRENSNLSGRSYQVEPLFHNEGRRSVAEFGGYRIIEIK